MGRAQLRTLPNSVLLHVLLAVTLVPKAGADFTLFGVDLDGVGTSLANIPVSLLRPRHLSIDLLIDVEDVQSSVEECRTQIE